MYIGTFADKDPDRPALVMAGSGRTLSYGELDERSTRFANHLRSLGVRPGDHIAVLMENQPSVLEVTWAAMRSGLYLTAVNHHLTANEAAYIINDCDAAVIVTSDRFIGLAHDVATMVPQVTQRLMAGATVDGWDSYEEAVTAASPKRPDDEPCGEFMLYSSGTTGQPKGIENALTGASLRDGHPRFSTFMSQYYGFRDGMRYLSPAPLYHAAPLSFTWMTQCFGGTSMVMEQFDAAEALRLIEQYAITHSQWVPTMFVRMLKLSDEVRTAPELRSQEVALHAAAPCPVSVKEQMIEWWGPILIEYYAGTEGNGFTCITSEEWLQHRGSVGQSKGGPIHVCDDDGNELPVGEIGLVYFEALGPVFQYHRDPEQTSDTRHPEHRDWTTIGDIGRVDADGYLYLTDRKAFMIVSGGVNIYPQEAEDALITHPRVIDVAVFGVPNTDLGEEVKAVVQPVAMPADAEAGKALERELITHCRAHLSAYKCPRTVDFVAELPRRDTGKLAKRDLRDHYWQGHDTRVI